MAKPSLHTTMAAAAALACLSANTIGFAVPQVEPTTQSRAFSNSAALAGNSAAEPHGIPAAEGPSSPPSWMQAFAMSSAIGIAMGARSRIARKSAKSPEDTYKTVIKGGEVRLSQTASEVILSGIVTGFYIGFGGVLCSTVGGSLSPKLEPGIQRFLFGAVGFPLSIFLTTIAGGQGFTPNVSVMATAFLRKGADRSLQADRIMKMAQNLGLAYLGNAIGLLTIAALANFGHLPAVPASIVIAKHKVHMTFMQVLIRGILGGWLIGLAVWTAQAAEEVVSKFVTIWLCISTYVICQYEHCLANIFFVPCAIFAGAPITWGQFISHSLIPATIGNAIGGFAMLAGFYRWVYGRKCYLDEQMGVVCDVDYEEAEQNMATA